MQSKQLNQLIIISLLNLVCQFKFTIQVNSAALVWPFL